MTRKRYECGGTNRIPSRSSHESAAAAARVTTKFDVVDALVFSIAHIVQKLIEETKWILFVGKKEVIHQ